MIVFKERCSALGHLMVGAELAGQPIQLTSTELKREADIIANKEAGKKLTEAMDRDWEAIQKRKQEKTVATLSKGAKTHVRNKWYGEFYDFQKFSSNKYTRNGHEQEDAALKEIGRLLGYRPLLIKKNIIRKENDWIHGECDWLPKPFVLDIKNVFEPQGLDFGDELDTLYSWQIKGYGWLYERDHGIVAKVLRNKSVGILNQTARKMWVDCDPMNNSFSDIIPEEFMEYVYELYNFEKKPIEERCHLCCVEVTQNDIDLIKQQVELAREEYNSLSMPSHYNQDVINKFKLVK